jgi:hypothetical protein
VKTRSFATDYICYERIGAMEYMTATGTRIQLTMPTIGFNAGSTHLTLDDVGSENRRLTTALKSGKFFFRVVAPVIVVACVLTACGGHKILKEPLPITATEKLAAARDENMAAELSWVIVRDGPGTWVRNADWDEYIMTLTNHSDNDLRVESVFVYDLLSVAAATEPSRRSLVKESRAAAHRYEDQGLEVKAGAGAGAMIIAGTAVGIAGVGLAAGGALLTTGAAAAAATGILLAPVLAAGGIMKGVNNEKVARQIAARQSTLPLVLKGGEVRNVTFFFPLAPSPQKIEVGYSSITSKHILPIDTHEILQGLHIIDQDHKATDSSE